MKPLHTGRDVYRTNCPICHDASPLSTMSWVWLPVLAASILSLCVVPRAVAAQETMNREQWERAVNSANSRIRLGKVGTLVGAAALGAAFLAEGPEYNYFGDPIPGQEERREEFERNQLFLAIGGLLVFVGGVERWISGSRSKRELEELDRQGLVAALPQLFLLGSSRPAWGVYWEFSVP